MVGEIGFGAITHAVAHEDRMCDRGQTVDEGRARGRSPRGREIGDQECCGPGRAWAYVELPQRPGDHRRGQHVLDAYFSLEVGIGIIARVPASANDDARALFARDPVAVHVSLSRHRRHRDRVEREVMLVKPVPDEIRGCAARRAFPLHDRRRPRALSGRGRRRHDSRRPEPQNRQWRRRCGRA